MFERVAIVTEPDYSEQPLDLIKHVRKYREQRVHPDEPIHGIVLELLYHVTVLGKLMQ